MYNILPKVSKKASSSRVEESFFSNWKLHSADPKTAVIPSYLQSEFTPDPEELKVYRDEPVKSRREPNFVPSEELNSLEPSPLDHVARGVADPIGPVVLESKHIFSLDKSTYKPPKPEKVVDLVICVENRLLSGLDIFMQRSGSIKNFRLLSNQQCVRSLTGAHPSLSLTNQLTSLFVLCSTAKRSTVVTTSRQEVKTWTFETDSKIGLEVEVLYGRLVVSKVLPETQATPFELHLDGAEILAVNSQRVVDLEEFQEAMLAAKDYPTVQLLMASYRGGRGKLDDMYLFDLQKSQGMKSVLSNLFSGARGDNNSRPDTASVSSAADTEEEEDAKGEADDDAKSELSEEKSAKGSEEDDKDNLEEKEETSVHAESKEGEHVSVAGSIADSKSVRSKKKNMYVYDSDSEEEDKNQNDDNNVYMDEDGGMMVQKKTSTVQLEIKEPPKVDLEDSHSIGEDSSQSDWNHLTAAGTKDAQPKDIVPYVSLTCMPRLLTASKEYGVPRRYVQFTNFSSIYTLEVNWVDEDSVLIQRANIASGQTHFELASQDHVWMLAAKPQQAPSKHNKSVYSTSTSGTNLHASSSVSHNVGYDNDKPVPVVIFRPSQASLSEGKCVSMLWSPYTSLSLTQTVHTLSKKEAVSNSKDRVLPCIHIQLLDPPSRSEASAVNIHADEETLGKLLRKPLTKTGVLNKFRKRRPPVA